MLNLLRTSIVLRSSFVVLVIALCVGGLFAVFTYAWESDTEQELARARIGALLSTVENTVSIACYLSDANLAKEVGQGLLKNDDVAAIKITDVHKTLSELKKENQSDPSQGLATSLRNHMLIQRQVFSPFNPKEKVCDIELTPDFVFIQDQVNHKARFTSFLLMLQALIMAGALVYVVMSMITRPIKTISDRLHRLPPDTPSSLPLPHGNEKDEIGQLVRDVNTLFSKLFNIIKDERELRIEHQIGERKFRAIFDNSETGIFLLKQNGEIISYNHAYLRIFSIHPGEMSDEQANQQVNQAIDEQNSEQLHTQISEHNSTQIRNSLNVSLKNYALRLHGMMQNAAIDDNVSSEDFVIEVGDPLQKKWINLVLSAVEDGVLQGLVNDITERKLIEESANQLAVTDHLTGVANRLGFEKAMSRIEFEMHAKLISNFYLLMIDLDGFKHVNDDYGHEAGDKVLCNFAQLITMIVRKSDFIARLGGDEFIIILKDIDHTEQAQHIAQKIINDAAHPYLLEKHMEINIGASIGITYVNTLEFDANDTLHMADEAMYAAKRAGKNRYAITPPRP